MLPSFRICGEKKLRISNYRNKCELLIEDIRQVLEIMKDSMTDECKQNMTNILNKWGAERKGEE